MSKNPKPRFPTPLGVKRALDTLLEGHYPPPQPLCENGLQKTYTRRHDDTDGERGAEQNLAVGFTRDGDTWLILGNFTSLRFRTSAGGGASPRVHRALVLLAEAIRRDNQEHPQDTRERNSDMQQ